MQSQWKAALALVAALSVLGCGSSGKGTVTGKLSVSGKPVTTGANIAFVGPTGESASATVDKDGNYKMENAPVGNVKVTVTNGILLDTSGGAKTAVDPSQMGKQKASAGPSMGKEVPKKYGQADNGLSFTVKSGSNTIDIDLKP